MTTKVGILAVLAMLLGAAGFARAAAADASAEIRPDRISLGEASTLVLTVSGDGAARAPDLPAVDGLHFDREGQSSRMEIVNGRRSSSVSYLYRVSPDRVGSFTIPVAGRTLRLVVTAAPPGRSARRGPLAPAGPAAESPPETAGDLAFLRVVPAREAAYVGERVPVEIRAYFREGLQASLTSLPSLTGDAFVLGEPEEEPVRARATVGGRPWTVLSWDTWMSAVKAGEYPVGGRMDATLLVPEERRRPRRTRSLMDSFGDDFFGDAFMDDDFFDSFFSRGREKPVTLESEPVAFRVMALPAAGRPADFGGAVGSFEVESSASPLRLAAGDPITLRMTVRGRGNFDRVGKPALADESGFKVYPASQEFTPRDASGLEGEKTFEQALVARHEGVTEIPAVEFGFFDPAEEKYVTARAPAIPIRVEAGSGVAPAARAGSGGDAPESAGDAAAIPTPAGLVPDRSPGGRRVASLRPLVHRPWFLGLAALALGALLTGVIRDVRLRRRAADPEWRRRKAADRIVGDRLAEMDRAVTAADTPGFFRAARAAIDARPEPDPDLTAELEAAAAVTYSGTRFSSDELARWRSVVREEVQ